MTERLFQLLDNSTSAANTNNPVYPQTEKYIARHGEQLVQWLTRNDSLFRAQDIEDALLQPSFQQPPLSSGMRDHIAQTLIADRNHVYPVQVGDEQYYASTELARTEQKLFRRAAAWAQDTTRQIDDHFLVDAIAAHQQARIAKGKDPKPLEDITSASQELLSPGRLKILVGPPGAGKTTVIKLVGDSLHAAGHDLMLSAQSGMLCQKLGRETKQNTMPLPDLVAHLQQAAPGDNTAPCPPAAP